MDGGPVATIHQPHEERSPDARSHAQLRTFALCSIVIAAATAAGCAAQEPEGADASDVAVPVYSVDASWPKLPLRNKWLIQGVPVMVTDHNDHIWVVSRPRDITPDENGAASTPPRTDCCVAAPAILEFDPEGTLLNAWGGPGYHPDWPAPGIARPGPASEHAIAVDREGNVWLSGQNAGDGLQKFTSDGRFLWDFGHRGPRPAPGETPPPIVENNQQTDVFPRGISQFTLDEDARELYIAQWKRILVYDMDTGAFKRGWGGKGMPLSEISNAPTPDYDWKAGPPPDQEQLSSDLHCVHLSVDDLVYVCDRDQNRIHVFTTQGTFVTNFLVAGSTIAALNVEDPGIRRSACVERRSISSSRMTRIRSTCSWPMVRTIASGFTIGRRAPTSTRSAVPDGTPGSCTGLTASPWTRSAISTPARSTTGSGCRSSR